MRANGASPTIVYKEDKPVLVVGSPGGHGIVTGVVQTILNVLDHGMSAVEAVSASRFHCEHGPIQIETRIPQAITSDLEQRGHSIENTLTAYGYISGAIQLVIIDPKTGSMSGGADPRRAGMVLKSNTSPLLGSNVVVSIFRLMEGKEYLDMASGIKLSQQVGRVPSSVVQLTGDEDQRFNRLMETVIMD